MTAAMLRMNSLLLVHTVINSFSNLWIKGCKLIQEGEDGDDNKNTFGCQQSHLDCFMGYSPLCGQCDTLGG